MSGSGIAFLILVMGALSLFAGALGLVSREESRSRRKDGR